MVNLAQQIEERIPPKLLELVRTAGKLASTEGQTLCLVGGAVRDLLLGRPNLDLDLVVEGNAILLAQLLAKASGGEVLTHPRFGTARFQLGQFRLDLATARSESYSRPGALPSVKPGSLSTDLLRRDFSINAMAIHLDSARFGELVDSYGGRADLEHRLIRVLHQRSFIDDATRIFRALRYEQRLGFQLEQATEQLLRRDLSAIGTITGERLRHELELILEEEQPERILYRAEELGVLGELTPNLKGNGWLAEKFDQARQTSGKTTPGAALYLALLVYRLSPEENESFLSRLKIAGKKAQTLRDTLGLKADFPTLSQPELSPSSIYSLLQHRSQQAVQACALASDSIILRQRLELYLSQLRHVKTYLNGNALKRMGIPPGERLGQILHMLHEAKLDQRVKTREDEEALVRHWLAESAAATEH